MEVDFVLDGCFLPAGAGEHAAAGFYHAWMATEIGGGVGGREIPDFNVLSDQVVDAASFALPVRVVPGTADRRDVFQPGGFGSDFFEFIAITKFVDVAGPLHTEEAMLAGHGCATFFPILIDRADVADVGSDSCDGGEEEMILAAAAEVEGEAAFGETAEEKLGVFLHFVEEWRQLALGDALDEKFEDGLVGRRGDGVGALEWPFGHVDAECSVLTGEIRVGAARIDFQDEEVFGDFAAIENAGWKEFVWTGDQDCPQRIRMRNPQIMSRADSRGVPPGSGNRESMN